MYPHALATLLSSTTTVVLISPPLLCNARMMRPPLVASHAIIQVTIDQVIGGARGIKSMVWETSNLDADEV